MAHDAKDAAHDLDETRRLLYMSLVASKTKKYNLAGTLVNALRHHQGVDDPLLEEKIVSLVENDVGADEPWARGQIGRLTAELGEA